MRASLRPARAAQLAVAAVAAIGLIELFESQASGAGCDNSWLNPASGDWFNDGNWSAGHSPTDTEQVCIEVDGDYTVSLVGSDTVASLSIGATTTSGTQGLAVGVSTQGGSLTAPSGVTNGNRGVIAFDSNRHSSSIHTANSTFVNDGEIAMSTAPGLEAAVAGNLRNAQNGVIHVSGLMGFYSEGGEADTLLNRGQIQVADASTLVVRRSSTFTNAPSGHISSTGTGQVASGLELDNTFNEAGTTLGPAPVRIYGGILNYTGDGASHIEASGQFNLTGTLHDGQSLKVTDANANAFGGFTNAVGGELAIHSQGFSSSLNTSDAPLLNHGTITLTGAGTPGADTALFGPVTNASDGVVRANYNTGLYSAGSAADTFLNQGRVEIADGTTVIIRRSSTFTNAGSGHIEGDGTGHVRSGAELDTTFNEGGTTTGPKPVVVVGGALNYIGDGTSDIEATGQFNLAGTLHAGQSLTIADGTASAFGGFVNDGGQMRIEAFGVSSSLNVGSNAFTNDGTVRTIGGSGAEAQLFGDLTNTGTLDLEQNTGFFGIAQGVLATLTNEGVLTIADAKTLDFKRGTAFTQSAGRTTLEGQTSRLAVFEASGVPLTGGILEGTGTVAANVTNGGEVRPGTSPGTLNVDGAYTQTADGVLVAEIAAAGHDLLDATGAATLDGTLEIETEAGFTPTLGDTFKVVEGSSRTGELADVNGIGGGPYEVLYNPADVTLRTIDPSDLPSFTIDDVTLREGDAGTTNAAFRVHLSESQSTEVTVDFRTANGSAREPGDYTSTTGTLSFPPGVVQRSAVVPVVGDDVPEADEDFQVNLRNADGAQIADGRGIGTIENDELDAALVTPNRGGDACCITVTVHGAGFVPGAGLRLERAGEPDIVATRLRVADDGRSLAGLLNLSGRQRAPWDVTVANPAGRGADTLAAAFTVEPVRAPRLWIRIDGGGVARPDQPYTAMLAYGNTGNVDATGVMLRLGGIPSFDRVDLPVSFPPGLVEERAGEGRSAKFFISRLAPGTAYAPVQPFFEGSGNRTIRARIFGDQFDPAAAPAFDPATEVTMQVDQATDPATASPATLQGAYHVSGPAGGDIAFDYTLTNAAAHTPATIVRTEPATGVVRYRLRGTIELGAQIKAYDNVVTGPAQAFASLQRAGNIAAAAKAPGFAKIGAAPGDGPNNPLDIVDAHAQGIQAISREKLIDCLLHPPNGHSPIILNSTIEQQLRDYAGGGRDAGTLSLVPVPGGIVGEFAWEATTEAMGFTLGQSFEDVLGRELGNAAFNDPTLPQGPPGTNPENQTGFLDPDFADRVAAALIWCAPPPPPGNPPPSGGGSDVFKTLRVTNSRDPNEKAGPDGFGAQRYIEGDEPLPYAINFENVASATAPAQVVRITDQLDPSEVRLSSVSLGPVQFGDIFAGPPPGLKHWTTDIDLRPEQNLVVRVEADLDATGLLTWEFTSLDPDTLLPTTDPLAGFLPPNDDPPEGEGAVYFSADPVGSLASGDVIDNSASIVFDTNAPIVTNTWLNTIDNDLPTSKVASVTRTGDTGGCATDLAVTWSGSDPGSGIGGFDVYVSVDGGGFGLWRTQTTATNGTYPGEAGHSYRFYSLAQDRAGHSEAAPPAADASATVSCETTPPPPPGEPPANPDRDAPETTITKGPAKKTTKRKAKFAFEADEDGASFECKLDRKKYKPCSSPRKYKVKPGKHKFLVRATDAAGNTDPSPAKVKFRRLG